MVVHTQITKLASAPGLTSEEAEKDCTRTHNCGVFFAGGVGDVLGVGVGVGVGLGELDDGDGLGELELELGLDDAGLADTLPDGDAAVELPLDVLGLADAELADVDLAGDVDGLADADVLADADLLAGSLTMLAVSAAAAFGIDEQSVLAGWFTAVVARALAATPKPRNARLESRPSAAGLRNSALTGATSLYLTSRAVLLPP